MYRGRAAEKLAGQAASLPAGLFNECPYEDLVNPGRVHLDAFGNVHICQGLIMGNMWETALTEILTGYRAPDHPVCGPLAEGGPLQLAEAYGLPLLPVTPMPVISATACAWRCWSAFPAAWRRARHTV
jgi:hypothetical protein